MAEGMNGLLDFAQSPVGMGLLSAAFGGLASARADRGPLNTLGAAGLSGIAGYSAANATGLQRKKAELLQKQMQVVPTLYGKDDAGNSTFDWKTAASLGIKPEEIAKYAQLPNSTLTEVARTVDVPGADGGKQTMQYDKYGRPVGGAIASYVAPQLVDTGDKKVFATPTAGQGFNVNLSPDQALSDQRARIGLGLQSQANAIAQDANNVNRMGQRTQVVQGADGNNYLIDKGTGEARPAIITGTGGTVQSGPTAEANVKNQQNMGKLGDLMQQARKTLPDATASGLGAKVDDANRFFGVSTKSAQSAAKLAAIGGNMLMLMPRMEGPQSNVDVENYKTMAGRVGDATVPAAERAAAMDALEEIVGRYRNNPQGMPVQQNAAKPGAQQPATIMRTGKDASGRKVIQYSDGRIEYGN